MRFPKLVRPCVAQIHLNGSELHPCFYTKLESRRARYDESRKKEKYTLICVSAIIPALLLVASARYATSSSEESDDSGRTIRTVGSEQVRINRVITSNFRFSPNHAVHVKQGDTITLKETTNDGHTFTLVEASALPTTFNGVIFCGAPAIISPGFVGSAACVNNRPGYPFTLHLTQNFPPPWLPIPTSCTPGPICFQFVDGGVASNTNTLGLDTAWSFNSDGSVKTPGDSVLLLPGQTFTLTVTAPVGTHLHFMCIFHPWMQGEIVVDAAGE